MWVLSVAGALLGARAGCHPVGTTATDLVLTGAFAGLVVLLGAHAHWPSLLLGGLVLAAVGGTPVVRGVGVAVAIAALALDRRGRIEPSAASSLALAIVQGALRLPTGGRLGTSAALAALATVPLAAAGTRRLPPVLRRKAVALAGGALVLVGLAAASAGYASWRARTDLEAAEHQADAGILAAQQGDTAGVRTAFAAASIRFSEAHAATHAWWTFPAAHVPLVAQHLAVLDDVARLGGRGARLALAGVTEVDVEHLRLDHGRLDPGAVAADQPVFHRLARRARALQAEAAGVGSPWLVAPVRTRLARFERSVAKAAAGARTAELAADLAPRLLGASGRRTYLLAFVTPAEARAAGGFLGNYGVLTVDRGRLDLQVVGRNDQLDAAGDEAAKRIVAPADYVARYGQFDPAHTWGNLTMSPDFRSVGEAMANLFPGSGGEPVDGVIRIDPTAMAGLLAVTGPVDVPGLPYALTSRNATQFLLADQYARFDDQAQRSDLLGDVAKAAFHRLTRATSASPSRFGAALGPSLAHGNLALWFRDPQAEAFAHHLGADGALPAHRGDLFGVTTQNAGGNKIDAFLQRTITERTQLDAATGRATTEVTVSLHNDAPPGGFADYVIGNLVHLPRGTNRSYVSFFSSRAVRSATLDGHPVALAPDVEGGYRVASTFVDLPPGSTRTFRLVLVGTIDLHHGTFRFDHLPQVMVRPDRIRWDLTVDDAGRLRHAGTSGGAPPVTAIAGVPADRGIAVDAVPSVGPWSVTVGVERVQP